MKTILVWLRINIVRQGDVMFSFVMGMQPAMPKAIVISPNA
jgi:hypothetical protein